MESVKIKLGTTLVASSIIIGIISSLLLLKLKLEHLPIIISFYRWETAILLCMIGCFLYTFRLKLKQFKWLALIGILISLFNIMGFEILYKLIATK